MTTATIDGRTFEPPVGVPVRAVLVWAHGGSFVAGSVAEWSSALQAVADTAEVRVVGVEYRLAPASPHPAAVLDTLHAAESSCAATPNLPVIFAGDSAGATIAGSAAALARRRGVDAAGLVMLYPPLDPACTGPSYRAAPWLFPSGEMLRRCWQAYLSGARGAASHGDVPASLLDAAAHRLLPSLPATRIAVGTDDPVRDECLRLERLLRRVAVDARCDVADWLQHGAFPGIACRRTESARALAAWIGAAVGDIVSAWRPQPRPSHG